MPTVRQIVGTQSGDDVLVTIEIRHSSPSSNHYVNRVEVQMDGSTMTVELSSQSSVTFTVNAEFENDDLGKIRARALCTVHDWSEWVESASVGEDVASSDEESEEPVNRGIPGYPAESILLGAMGVVFLLWMFRRSS